MLHICNIARECHTMNKNLNDSEIGFLISNWDQSDDDLEFSDDDIELFVNEVSAREEYPLFDPNVLDIDNFPMEIDNEGEFICTPENINLSNTQPNSLLTSTSHNLNSSDKQCTVNSHVSRTYHTKFSFNSELCMSDKNATPKNPKKTLEFQKLKWKKGNFVNEPQLIAHNENMLTNNILELTTPYEFFTYFFTDDFLSTIKYESELFATQTNVNKTLTVSINELKRYIGILIYNSICIMPNVRDYWSDHLGLSHVYTSLSQKRFEEIRRYLHFNDNSKMLDKEHPNFDRLHKIRPLIDHLNNKFNSIPYPRDLSLDEQLCATKARNFLKKYMPAKPHKWGFEFFVLCDSKGFSHQFEIYSGQENDKRFRLPHEPDLGASSNIVVRLTRNIERNKNHRVYFDNFYSSIPLAAYLKENGILCLGTIRKDRLPNNKIPDEKTIKKDPRGKSYEYISVFENTPITVTSWKDNKQVNLLSTYCGTQPMLTTKRYDKNLKKKIEIECPYIIKEYNRFMGGVDLLDSLIGRYKIRMRSRKWYMRIFYHLIDMSVVNSWLLYKRARTQIGQPIEYTLKEWRKTLAHTLTNIGFVQTPTRGRPSLEKEIKKNSGQDQPLGLLRMSEETIWGIGQIRLKKKDVVRIPNVMAIHFLNVVNVMYIYA